MAEDLNEVIEEVVSDAEVMTVAIDDTLTVSGEAADAKAVGDALALKADKSELQNSISVNGEEADAQGRIIIDASEIEMTEGGQTTVKEAIEAAAGRTADEISMSSDPEAVTVSGAMEALGADIAAVDGKIDSMFPSGIEWIRNSNLNDIKTNGYYPIGDGNTNVIGPWGYLSVIAPRDDQVVQMYVYYQQIYVREFRSSTSWTPWVLVNANVSQHITTGVAGVDAWKVGNMMVVTVQDKQPGDLWAVPAGYRPGVTARSVVRAASTGATARLTIGTDTNTLTIGAATDNSVAYYGQIVWAING